MIDRLMSELIKFKKPITIDAGASHIPYEVLGISKVDYFEPKIPVKSRGGFEISWPVELLPSDITVIPPVETLLKKLVIPNQEIGPAEAQAFLRSLVNDERRLSITNCQQNKTGQERDYYIFFLPRLRRLNGFSEALLANHITSVTDNDAQTAFELIRNKLRFLLRASDEQTQSVVKALATQLLKTHVFPHTRLLTLNPCSEICQLIGLEMPPIPTVLAIEGGGIDLADVYQQASHRFEKQVIQTQNPDLGLRTYTRTSKEREETRFVETEDQKLIMYSTCNEQKGTTTIGMSLNIAIETFGTGAFICLEATSKEGGRYDLTVTIQSSKGAETYDWPTIVRLSESKSPMFTHIRNAISWLLEDKPQVTNNQ